MSSAFLTLYRSLTRHRLYAMLNIGGLALGIAVFLVLMLFVRFETNYDRVLPGWVRWAWWMSLPVALVLALAWGLAATGPLTERWTPAHLGYLVLPPACAAWGALTLALAIVVQMLRSRRNVPAR